MISNFENRIFLELHEWKESIDEKYHTLMRIA